MSDFENYIYQPEVVKKKMPEVAPASITTLRRINDEGWLDEATEFEIELIYRKQNRLFTVGEVLARYLMGKTLLQESDDGAFNKEQVLEIAGIQESVQLGMALGSMAAMDLYRKAGSVESVYSDISNDTLAAFAGKDSIEIDMLVDAILENTPEQTEPLRNMIEFWLEFEDGPDSLRQAAATAAVISYSLRTYEKSVAFENQFNGIWDKHEMNKRFIASLPQRIREIKGTNKF